MKTVLFQRNEGVSIQEMEGDLFLANEESGSIYRLNTIGAAFWRILENPCDLETILDLFCAGFPNQSRSDLCRDITDLIDQLEDHSLILRKEN